MSYRLFSTIAGLSQMLLLGLTLACTIRVPSASAEVYVGWDSSGAPMYSDRPQAGFKPFLDSRDGMAIRPASAAILDANRQRYSTQIEQVAQELDLPSALLHAVIHVESGYDAEAVSPKGAVGLMQLMPATAHRFGVKDSRDPEANLRGGARYLRTLLAQFGELSLALAAYNAGEAAVLRHSRSIPPYAETQAYVRSVQRRYAALTGPRQ